MSRERGMVTAEMAVIAPFGLAFAFLLFWVVSLGYTQVELVDAAREASRAVARGESVESAERLAQRVAPGDSTVSVSSDDGLVEVTVTARRDLPIPFFRGIAERTLASTSVAAVEAP